MGRLRRRSAHGLALVVIAASCLVHATAPASADSGAMVSCALQGSIPPSNDTSTGAVPLGFSLNYYGQTYTSVYVNNNGSVTFGAPAPKLTAFDNHAGTPREIAPFAADVDTSGPGSGITHFGRMTYNGQPAFCVDWGNPNGAGVGYFHGHTDLLDSFQLVLVDSGNGNFQALFDYLQLQWETGDAQGGHDGIGGTQPASAGFLAGDGNPQHLYAIRGSGVSESFLDGVGCSDDSTGGAGTRVRRHGLSGVPFGSTIAGRWAFDVVNGAPVMPVAQLGGGSFVEGDSGRRTYDIAVTLDSPSASPVSVQYSVLQGPQDTATPGVDFVPVDNATVAVQPEHTYNCLVQTTVQLPVVIIGDTTPEPNESFTFALDGAEGASLGARTTSRATIFDDDPSTGLHVDVNNAGMVQGNAVATPPLGTNKLCFTITLSAPTEHVVSVTYETVGGTAQPNVDFVPIPRHTFYIGKGHLQSGCILVGVFPNPHQGSVTKQFDFDIVQATGAVIGHGVGVGTIRGNG